MIKKLLLLFYRKAQKKQVFLNFRQKRMGIGHLHTIASRVWGMARGRESGGKEKGSPEAALKI
jgi:hypothetical protein